MKTQHTPGPWEVDGDFVQTVPDKFGFKSTIARTDYVGPIGMRKANARLIAAAPECYESLREVLDAFLRSKGSDLSDDDMAMIDDAEKAIARAEGKE